MTRLRTSNRDLTHWIIGLGVGLAVYFVGCHFAHAAGPADIQTTTPDQQAAALIELLMTGEYVPAVGMILCVLVAVLRGGLGGVWPWFKTKAGGYVLGFGSAALLYLGTAMQAGQVSFGVAFAALGAGWAAAGGWEHLKDVLTWLRPPMSLQKQSTSGAIHAAIVMSGAACLLVGGLALWSCKGTKSPGAVVVDCTGGSGTGIVANVLATLDQWTKAEPDGCRLANGFDWKCIESGALTRGEQIGGCALAELVQGLLGGTKAMPVDEGWLARAALENARGHWGGSVTWRTTGADL